MALFFDASLRTSSASGWIAACGLALAACAQTHAREHGPDPEQPHATESTAAGMDRRTLESMAAPEQSPATESTPGGTSPRPAGAAEMAEAAGDAALLVVQGEDGVLRALAHDGELLAELPPFEFEALQPGTWLDVHVNADFVLVVSTQSRDAYPPMKDDDAVQPVGSTLHFAMLLRRKDFTKVWQRQSEPLGLGSNAFLGDDGSVVINETELATSEYRVVTITSDGAERVYAGVTARSAPDADGWFVAVDPYASPPRYGFAGAGEGGLTPLSEPVHAPDMDVYAFEPTPSIGPGVAFHYLSGDDGGELALVHERPGALERIELGRAPPGFTTLASGASVWLLSTLDHAEGTTRPWLSVAKDDGATALVSLDDPSGIASVQHAGDDWFALYRAGDIAIPEGWFNAVTSAWKPSPALPSGLRPFVTDYCGSTGPSLVDGRALVSLRDDDSGGVYVEDAAGVLQPIGSPIRDAVYVNFRVSGETFELNPVAGDYTYCPVAFWGSGAATDDVFLVGGQTELVRGGRSLVIDARETSLTLDATGRFAALHQYQAAELVLHDLTTGAHSVVAGVHHVVGWY